MQMQPKRVDIKFLQKFVFFESLAESIGWYAKFGAHLVIGD